jgi:hypothetical protein
VCTTRSPEEGVRKRTTNRQPGPSGETSISALPFAEPTSSETSGAGAHGTCQSSEKEGSLAANTASVRKSTRNSYAGGGAERNPTVRGEGEPLGVSQPIPEIMAELFPPAERYSKAQLS